jgi:hypothetical protein
MTLRVRKLVNSRMQRSECSSLVVHRSVDGATADQAAPDGADAVFRAGTITELSNPYTAAMAGGRSPDARGPRAVVV